MKEDLTDFLFQTGEEFRWGLLFIYSSLVWSVTIEKGIKADHFFISSDSESWSSASKLIVISNDYGRYDNVPVKVKAELFQFSVNDFEADMKLHSLVLKELNVRMYSSELYDDYMSVMDAMDKKPVEEQNVNYYNNEKCWNRSR